MALKLGALGFEVVEGRDLDANQMMKILKDFNDRITGADIALFFYSGHALQADGENYLLPADTRRARLDALVSRATRLRDVLSIMESKTAVNFAILDASRKNTIPEFVSNRENTASRSEPGLARVQAEEGTMLAFSTQPANAAPSSSGRNSLFTRYLLKHLGTAYDVNSDFTEIRRDIYRASNFTQLPWTSSGLLTKTTLRRPAKTGENTTTARSDQALKDELELAYWRAAERGNTVEYFEGYLEQFPQGKFAGLVRLKMAELKLSAVSDTSSPGVSKAPDIVGSKRIALVIGNSDYRHVPKLANPENDAKLVAAVLSDIGFEIVGGAAQINLDKQGTEKLVQQFGRSIAEADAAVFYYAGHGIQVRGNNYLIPTEANTIREADVDFEMFDANLVLRQMEGSGSKLNVLILDACRNNPFGGRGFRSSTGGLAQMQAPEGTIISFSTQPGNIALDGEGANSPYTQALAKVLKKPGLDVFRTFNEIGVAVSGATGGQQQPWVSLSPIKGEFYFAGKSVD